MSTMTEFSIVSSNPHLSGLWKKDDIEAEMKDLGYEVEGTNWVDWVLTHLFDYELPESIRHDLTDSRVSEINFTVETIDQVCVKMKWQA